MSLTKTEFRKRKEGIGPEREKKDSSDDKGILERWKPRWKRRTNTYNEVHIF